MLKIFRLTIISIICALPAAGFAASDALSELTALTGPYSGSMILRWTYPGPDALPASSKYYIQYSSWPDYQNVAWSTSSAQVALSTGAAAAGEFKSYSCFGLGSGVTNYFRIWVSSGAGEDLSGISIGATNYALPFSVNPLPVNTTGLVVVSSGTSAAKLLWTPVNDSGVLGYNVYRSTNYATIGFAQTASVDFNTTYYYETGLDPAVTYYYIVRSSDAVQQSAALKFLGTLNSIAVPAHHSLNKTKDLSVSFWINPDNTSNFQNIIYKSDWANSWKILLPWSEGATVGKLEFDGPNRSGVGTAQNKVPAGQWSHVVCTYDSKTLVMNIYVNGSSEGTQGGMGSVGADYPVGINIGNDGTNRLYGALDDVIIYNRALKPAEISGLYASGVPPAYGMVGWWKINNTLPSQTSAADSLGINNGTISGTNFATAGKMGSVVSVLANGTLLAGPTTYVPADNSYTNWNQIEWQSYANSLGYEFKISQNADLSGVPDQSGSTSETNAVFSGLAQGTKYFWAVRSLIGEGVYTNWSSTKSFTYDTTRPAYSNPQAQKADTTIVDPTSVYIDTVPVSVRVSIQDTMSGLKTAQSELVPSSGCVLLVHMNEGSGSSAADASGWGNNGTFGAGTTWTTGKFSNALQFDGTTSSVTIPNNPSLNPAAITAEAWIYPTGKNGEQSILEKRNTGGFNLAVSGAAGVYDVWANVCDPSNNQTYAKVWTAINANTWTHVAMTYDGSNVKLYLNGVMAASSQTVTAVNITGSSDPLKIGKGNVWMGSYFWFQGSIDDVAVFNHAKTVDEIAVDYAGGLVKYSNNGGSSWSVGTGPLVAGTTGTTSAQYFTVNAVTFTESGSNRIQYFAQDMAGNLSASSIYTVLVDTTPPSRVVNLAAGSDPDLASARLTWTAPVEAGSGLNPGAYLFRYSSWVAAPASYDNVIYMSTTAVPGNSETRVMTGLMQNVTYWFALQTQDKALNWSVISNTVSYRIVYDPVPPAGISNLTALPGSSNWTINLRWTAPGNDELSGALNGMFELKYSSAGSINSANYGTPPDPTTTVQISTSVAPLDQCYYTAGSLVPGTSYWFAVKAYDGINWSVWNSSTNVSTVNTLAYTYVPGPVDIAAPAAITNLSGLVAYNGQIALSWTSPGDNGNTGTLQTGSLYEIQYASYTAAWAVGSAQKSLSASGAVNGEAKSFMLTGLADATTYYIVAWTGDAVPNWSPVSNGVTVYMAYAPAVYAPSDQYLWTNSRICDWASIAGALDYTAQIDNVDSFASIDQTISGTVSSGTFSLSEATQYWARVRAQVRAGVYSCWSATRTFKLDYTNASVSNLTTSGNSQVADVQDSGSGLRVGQSELVLSSGCVLMTHMNEGSGTALADVSGYGNTGKVESGASWSTGKFGNALQFDGTSSSATIPNSAVLNPAVITAEAWINPSNNRVGLEQAILDKRSGGGYALILWGDTGVSHLQAKIADPSNNQTYAEALVSNSQWNHVAMTYDGDSIKLYVNGALAISSQTLSAVDITGSIIPLKIGANGIEQFNLFYQGKIDEISVSNRVLSAEEIAAHYNSGAVKYSVNGGADWTIDAAVADGVISGSSGSTGLQTATASNIPLTNNSANDRIKFLVQDMAGNFTESAAMTVYGDTTAPAAINNLGVASKTETSITLSWGAPLDSENPSALPAGSLFKIQYSTFAAVVWSSASAQVSMSAAGYAPAAAVTKEVPSLTKDTTYYFRAWTADAKSNWSAISNGATDYTYPDTTAPVIGSDAISKAGLIGDPIVFVSTATDNTGISGITLYYNLYSTGWSSAAMTLSGAGSMEKNGIFTLDGSQISKEGTISYYISAVDAFNNTGYWNSAASPQEITVSRTTQFAAVKEGKLSLPGNDPNHGTVSLEIPKGALSAAVAIFITQENAALEQAVTDDTVDTAKNGGKPVAVFEFGPTGTLFNSPVTMTLLYFDPNDTGLVQLEDGTITNLNENTSNLQIFYWDGLKWRLVGGTVDRVKNTVTVKITHFSKYAIFAAGAVGNDASPEEKFVTKKMPATFGYKADEVTIYDIAGFKVVKYTKADFGGASIQWNGTDGSGNFVESGIYIFKIKTTENKTVSGTIVVAK
jgi:hypothetical protein